ncbi:MAG: polyprenyl synthetase family protein, partial [Bacteroidia bacterium]|nr:polyprenyl synthetase family protein [Bacteroidia bacterium]
IGGDILENKKTLLWIEAIKRATPEQKAALQQWYATDIESQTKIDSVTSLFRTLQVDVYAREKMNLYFNKAEDYRLVLSQSVDTSALEQLASDLQNRQS